MKCEIHGKTVEIDDSLVKEQVVEIEKQIEQYLNGERRNFELRISYPDNFTGDIMKAMDEISYGETSTYGKIAEKLDTSPVAVGQACARNPVPIIVPCHRVVSKNGVGGYRYGELKQKLLELERKNL